MREVVVWCRIGMRNNCSAASIRRSPVVVWCRIGMRNNEAHALWCSPVLWFDVELEWETTWPLR